MSTRPAPRRPQDREQARERRLREEHELDLAPVHDLRSDDEATTWDGAPADAFEPSTASATAAEPEVVGRPRRRRRPGRRLGVALGALMIFVAGTQAHRLSAGGHEGSSASGPARRAAPPTPAAGSHVIRGRVASIDGSTIRVRDREGALVALHTATAAASAQGQAVTMHGIRPGDSVDVESARGRDGRLTVRSITVLRAPRAEGAGR